MTCEGLQRVLVCLRSLRIDIRTAYKAIWRTYVPTVTVYWRDCTGRQVSWVVKKSFRLTKLKIEDEIDNMQTQN